MKTKGQVTALIGILVGFAAIAIVAVIMPVWLTFVELGVNGSVNSTYGSLIAILINLTPVMLVLALLILIIILILGR